MRSQERCCLTPQLSLTVIKLPINNCSIYKPIIHQRKSQKTRFDVPRNPEEKLSPVIQRQDNRGKSQDSSSSHETMSGMNIAGQKCRNSSSEILQMIKRSSGLQDKSINSPSTIRKCSKSSASQYFYTSQYRSLSVKSKRITFLYRQNSRTLDLYLKAQMSPLPKGLGKMFNTQKKVPSTSKSLLSRKVVDYIEQRKKEQSIKVASTISISSYLRQTKQTKQPRQVVLRAKQSAQSKPRSIVTSKSRQLLRPWSRNSVGFGNQNNNQAKFELFEPML